MAKAVGAISARTERTAKSDEAARARIITAARRRFASAGVEGASTRQIAEAAGVAQSLLLYYFKTKEALWRAVIDDLFAQSAAEFARANAEPGHADLAADERLMAGARIFIGLCRKDADLHRLMTIEGRRQSDRLKWLVETHLREMFEGSTDLIREGQAQGLIRKGDPVLLYYTIIAIAGSAYSFTPEMSLLAGRQIDPAPEDVEDLIRSALLVSRRT